MDKNSCSIIIDGIETNICIIDYRNRLLIIISQFEKLGSMITINKESPIRDFSNHSEIYTIKTISGIDDIKTHVAARFIAEHTNIDRPVLLSICLKNYEPHTLKPIVQVINQIKPW